MCLPPFAKAAKDGATHCRHSGIQNLWPVIVEAKTLAGGGPDPVPPTLRKNGEGWGTPCRHSGIQNLPPVAVMTVCPPFDPNGTFGLNSASN